MAARSDAPIFAETVSAFTILCADGSEMTINTQSPPVGEWSPLQFARVSLGGLGIVTSVTIDVLDRPWATTLQGGTERMGLADKPAFVEKFKTLLKDHTRLETFFTPYATDSYGFPCIPRISLRCGGMSSKILLRRLRTATEPDQPNACVLAAKNPPNMARLI